MLQQAFDDNVLLVSGKGMAPLESWVTSAGIRVAWNRPFVPGGVLESVSMGFAPESTRYWSARSEDFTAHRATLSGKFRRDSWSGGVDASVAGIDGNARAPSYPTATHDDQRSAYATAAARERRRQVQVRARSSLRYDRSAWFGRADVSLLSLDLMTDWRAEPGYQNYVDRRDLNGGFDFGWKSSCGLGLTAGYRRGFQFQQSLPGTIDRTRASASSGYDRFLAGVEGKIGKWLTLAVQAGPERHTYPEDSATRTVLVAEGDEKTWFAEASAVIAPVGAGSLNLKFKRWMWLSSTGKVPLFDATFEAAYRHPLSPRHALEVGFKASSSDYSCARGTASLRDDCVQTASLKLSAGLTRRLSLTLSASQDWGRNGKADLAVLAPTQFPRLREFDHRIIAATSTYKF